MCRRILTSVCKWYAIHGKYNLQWARENESKIQTFTKVKLSSISYLQSNTQVPKYDWLIVWLAIHILCKQKRWLVEKLVTAKIIRHGMYAVCMCV